MKKNERDRKPKLSIYRHGQAQQDSWIKSKSQSMAEIILIYEREGRRDIKGIVSIKDVSPPHTPYSLEMEEIFPEKMP